MEFEAGVVRIALHAIPPEYAEGIVISDPPVVREENPIKLVFEVADLLTVVSRLEAAGVTTIRRSWGACDVVDPEGNMFQIMQTHAPADFRRV